MGRKISQEVVGVPETTDETDDTSICSSVMFIEDPFCRLFEVHMCIFYKPSQSKRIHQGCESYALFLDLLSLRDTMAGPTGVRVC